MAISNCTYFSTGSVAMKYRYRLSTVSSSKGEEESTTIRNSFGVMDGSLMSGRNFCISVAMVTFSSPLSALASARLWAQKVVQMIYDTYNKVIVIG